MARMTLDMSKEFDELLSNIASESGRTKAETIRRAVASYAYLRKEEKQGGRVSIVSNDKVQKEVILP